MTDIYIKGRIVQSYHLGSDTNTEMKDCTTCHKVIGKTHLSAFSSRK